MSALDLVTSLNFPRLMMQEAVVNDPYGQPYWHACFVDENGKPISGGFHQDKMVARKIALSELIERTFFRSCSRDPSRRDEWALNTIKTACGFAAGFDRSNTIERSVREATERWVMSKWIDEGYFIERLEYAQVEFELSGISKYFAAKFDSVWFFRRPVTVILGTQVFNFVVGQTMGFANGGIFPGSSAHGNSPRELWEHSLLESYRHLLGVKNNPASQAEFPANKVRYFARNADVAIAQIKKADRSTWPMPNVVFHKNLAVENDSYYIARTIVGGWTCWSEGPLDRFLY